MITEVTAYKTSDSKFFDHKADAERHERMIVIGNYMLENPIRGSDLGCRVDANDICDWLIENPETNKQILIDLANEV